MKITALAAISATLVLTACGTSSVSTGSNQAPVVTSISGKLQGWTLGQAELRYSEYFDGVVNLLAKGAIAADGSFSVALPSDTAIMPFTEQASKAFVSPDPGTTCSSVPTLSDPTAYVGFADFGVYVDGVQDHFLVHGSYDLDGEFPNYYRSVDVNDLIYSDKPLKISGIANCTSTPGSSSKTTYNVSLSKGWNVVKMKVDTNYILASRTEISTTTQASVSAGDLTKPWTAHEFRPPEVTVDATFAGVTSIKGTTSDNVGTTKVVVFRGMEKIGETTLTATPKTTVNWAVSVPSSITLAADDELTAFAYDAESNEGAVNITVASATTATPLRTP